MLAGVGAVLVAAGCGGSPGSRTTARSAPEPAPAPAAHRPAHRVLIGALGDSITAGSPSWDPNPDVRGRLGDRLNQQSQYEYWARQRLGPNAEFRNCGVFGERTDQIAARLDDCARGARVLIVQGGINDVAQGSSIDAAADNIRAMVRHGKQLGLTVELVDVLPWNNGYPRAAPQIARLNTLIAGIARSQHVRLYPFFHTLEDPSRPGRMRSDWTIDGDHPSVAGYRRLGELIQVS